jgi:WD40 repeat protein
MFLASQYTRGPSMKNLLYLIPIVLGASNVAITSLSYAQETVQVNCLAFFPDSTNYAIGGTKGELILASVTDNRRKRFELGKDVILRLLFVSRTTLLAASNDGHIYIFNPVEEKIVGKLEGDNTAITAISCEHEQRLFGSSRGGHIFVWDLRTRELSKKLTFPKPIVALSVFPTNGDLAASLWEKSDVVVDMEKPGTVILVKGNGMQTVEVPLKLQGKVSTLTTIGDHGLLASSFLDGRILLYNLQEKKIVREWKHGDMVSCISVASKTKRFASGGADGRVKIWGLETEQLIRQYERKDSFVLDVSYSPDSQFLIYAWSREDLTASGVEIVRQTN